MTGKKVFLGDGLYAFYDGFMVGLTCERENGENTVYLESHVLSEFLEFIERTHGVKITVKKVEEV